MRTLMLFLVACSHAAPKPTTAQITITNWPEHDKVHCYFQEIPSPPEPLIVGDGIGMDRIVVHQRDWNAMVQWLADFRMHVSEIKDCLREVGAEVHTW